MQEESMMHYSMMGRGMFSIQALEKSLHTYVGAENEVISKSRVNLVFGFFLTFSTLFIFYKFMRGITQKI